MTQQPYENESFSRDETAALWCMRLADKSMSAADWSELAEWMRDEANESAFGEAIAVWQATDALAIQPEAIRLRLQTLERFQRRSHRRWAPRGAGFNWRWMSLAAAVCVVFLSIILLQRGDDVYETGLGERQVATLDDGSRLSLDAGTRVDVDFSVAARSVRLERGRVRFNVAHDSSRPFAVDVANKRIVAVGTSFSVERVGDQVRVLLYEGKVDVYERTAGQLPHRIASREAGDGGVITFAPGHELVLDSDASMNRVLAIDTSRSMTWEGGQLSFDNEPLFVAAERMNRYSVKKIVIDDSRASQLTVNGVFTAGDVDAMIEGLQAFHAVRVTKRDGQVHVASR
jgi:transmembrane sensor